MMSRPRRARRRLLAAVPAMMTILAPALSSSAPPPRQPDGAELLRALDRLSVVGHVLYVAAHPDDENTRLLAWLEHERLVRASYLSITRGDGGQNLIGPEQGPLLGLIRTQELMAARAIDGAGQLFTRARDFGYSKNPRETLAIWGHDEVLADVVWAIRRLRPDIILTRFPISGAETHGHHTASAMLAVEALPLAGDARYHPEQVQLAGTWRPRRVVWNKSSFFIKPGEDLSAFLKLETGTYNPALGISYGELAARSRSMHKSQGFGAAPSRGSAPEYFQLLAGQPFGDDLFEGVDLTWRRVPQGEKVIPLVERARAQFRPDRPQETLPALLEVRAAIASLPDNPWKSEKLEAVERLIEQCSGLWLEATAADAQVVPGGTLAITASILPRLPSSLSVVDARFPGAPAGKRVAVPGPLVPNQQPLELKQTITVPADAALSNPYWLSAPPHLGIYPVDDWRLIGLPESPPALAVEFTLRAGDQAFTVRRPVVFKWVDPVAGERVRPVEIAPPVTVTPDVQVLMFPDARPKALRVTIKAPVAGTKGTVRLEAPYDWRIEPAAQKFQIADRGGEQELRFSIVPPAAVPERPGPSATPPRLRAVAAPGSGKPVSRAVVRIEYPHITPQVIYPEAIVKLVRFDCRRTRTRIGYLAGAGDEVPQALRQVGYEVTPLTGEALSDHSPEQLGRFEAIVTGVRAFNTDTRLPFLHDKLMDYVRRGGTLVVQYSTANRISKVPPAIGPWPFEITQDRVTDEDAEVTIDLPSHPIVTRPNRLTAADFAGWVQERGLYFAGKWDPQYEALFSMHDPFEEPKKGSLLAARLGKGTFVYTGLAFFRQLPAGVPGAYRLFANILSYGADK